VNIRPIQILLDSFLKETYENATDRKEIRLAMLSLWAEQNVESTYDLTLYQCSQIPDFLEIREDGSYGKRTRRFLSDSQAKVEGRPIPGEDEYHPLTNEIEYHPVQLSDI
jgi:hypothetical protein